MKRAVVLAAVAGVVLTALAGPAALAAPPAPAGPAGPDYTPPPIAWGECPPSLPFPDMECGKLIVPLDYAEPDGATINLAVSRVRSTVPADQHQGVMLVNPGGPGGSGLIYSILGSRVAKNAGASYDWIGFDPRGVGSSEPALACDGQYFTYNRPNYVPDTPELEKIWLDRSAGYAAACASAPAAELLPHVKTIDTVNDMESMRKALAVEQINYYGFSYGSYLGQVYSTLFPDRVRRMVLDGIVDPRAVWYEANLNQDVAFDRNITIFFDWIAKYDSVYHLGTTGADVAAGFYKTRESLRTAPAGGVIGPDELTDNFIAAGYGLSSWDEIATAYASWVNDGDFAGLKAIFDDANSQQDGSDNAFAMYLATQCTDVQWPTDWATWQADNWRIHETAPFETWANAWYNAPCLTWGAPAGTPVAVDGSKAPPTLLISETLDAATPYEGALEVRSRFPNSALIEGVGGTTHSASFSAGPCVRDQVADYLASGVLPARKDGRQSDSQCDPVPQPTPAGVTGDLPFDEFRADPVLAQLREVLERRNR